MPWLKTSLAVVFTLAGACLARAGGAPEKAVIVVNGESWESRLVANEYRHLRQIPAGHLVEIVGLSDRETITADEFRDKILAPVTQAIDDRGLAAQIEYVLYSADIPTAIQVSGDVGSQKIPQVLTPVAAINGLTFLHQLVRQKDLRYLDLRANLYARRSVAVSTDTPWTEEEARQYGEAVQRLDELSRRRRDKAAGAAAEENANDAAEAAADAKALQEIVETLESLAKTHPASADLLYNLACALAQHDRPDKAIEALTGAVAAGYLNARRAQRDRDLESLRDDERFTRLIAQMKETPVTIEPAVGFRSDVGWGMDGKPTAPEGGMRYWLSTVLAVTRGRGLSAQEAVRNLERSVRADRTRPDGTIYFEQNDDIRSTTREWAFNGAAERLKSLGVKAVVESGTLPVDRADVAGAVIGASDFDWPKSNSVILPGAICEHLTSFGGVLTAGAGQTPLTELLRGGAAGASGTVTEPYAIQAKFPTPFIHVHYAEGCTLAEAFYQSVAGPYQLLIVGDALCQPWARRIEVTVAGLPESNVANGMLRLTPNASSPDNIPVAQFELCLDGRRRQIVQRSEAFEIDTTQLEDGHHELSILAIGADAVRTTGRLGLALTVQNSARRITAHCAVAGDQPWEQPFAVDVAAPEARQVELWLGRRLIATGEGGSASLTVEPQILGPGPVSLAPVARFDDGASILGSPIELRIASPTP